MERQTRPEPSEKAVSNMLEPWASGEACRHTPQRLPQPCCNLVQGIIAVQALALLDSIHFALWMYSNASERVYLGSSIHLLLHLLLLLRLSGSQPKPDRASTLYLMMATAGLCRLTLNGVALGLALLQCRSPASQQARNGSCLLLGKPAFDSLAIMLATALKYSVSGWQIASWYACFRCARREAGVRDAARDTVRVTE
ncbi:hypothetical protein JDV02_006538 [Purpureocillium takamizusanense]|uniref:Uncharacterized protein n=1 Tax=Purpureocillium takamizusanense TaxID=2060973 RepID=A0A9Q8QIH9_9HYPO|nr:uncharacterized protein JDV02_006538 [Purpureocillium takamizusanense]UNI20453.1 hypothetical protein JDV02_006538 [Purpureocillium takamizusanense]